MASYLVGEVLAWADAGEQQQPERGSPADEVRLAASERKVLDLTFSSFNRTVCFQRLSYREVSRAIRQ
jgi:hypothetical protein